MKKLLGMLVLGLLWCNVGFAETKLIPCEVAEDILAEEKLAAAINSKYHTFNFENKIIPVQCVESTLPPCQGEDYAQWTNCFGFYQGLRISEKKPQDYKKDSKQDYIGEFGSTPGKKEGQGMLFSDKLGEDFYTYFGEFKNDVESGQGMFRWKNRFGLMAVYIGEFKDGWFHGQGSFTYGQNGDKYVGEFFADVQHGQGTLIYTDQDQGDPPEHRRGIIKYVGEFKFDYEDGQGTLTYDADHLFFAGDTYVGGFKDGWFHGQGTYTFANGDKRIGKWHYHSIIEDHKAIYEKAE